MVSFLHKFSAGVAARGVQVTNRLEDTPYDAVLVIGGTRDLAGLWRARRRGVTVVQRLNGMNWLHRFPQHRGSWKHALRAEYGNFVLSLIRRRLASAIIYQSRFSHDWWERVYGLTPVPSQVVYNGVDLQAYTPTGPEQAPARHVRLLMVEGSLAGGYEAGLAAAIELAARLAALQAQAVELMIVGQAAAPVQQYWQGRLSQLQPVERAWINWAGAVPRDRIPAIDRAAHLLYSSDLNAACPNSVIEALACGLPVLAFDTGALAELVPPSAGRVIPYGGDPWKLDSPDSPALAQAALEILQAGAAMRLGGRAQAEAHFSLETMVDRYLEVLFGHA
jgi:glycosyltransferase involved in cell wall biosynthesis